MTVTVYATPTPKPAWAPVTHLARLMARLLDAELRDLPPMRRGWRKQLRLALRPMPRGGEDIAIVLARGALELDLLADLGALGRPHRHRAVWIIDSFDTQFLPPAPVLRGFDTIGFSQGYDRAHYERLFGTRALQLGWGSDALDLGAAACGAPAMAARPFDVLRVGRQPPAWEDDTRSEAACAAAGLRFHGRPPFAERPEAALPHLMGWYARTKFVIAHSNLAAPAPYTHPSKEYITARWTDALAAGASVAGCQPRSDLDLVDWPGATLDFDRIDLAENVAQLRAAVAERGPSAALNNHVQALRRLDWRWRIKALADRMGLHAPALEADLARLRQAIAAGQGALQDGPGQTRVS
ncbi:hypothetical protein Ga0609869_003578 [Rhodovulum iodosum]|uniref:Glycosyltransferase family 1 protein n=1 Tax=Rhodovulum iodosum TaxID=68291 RepID=A0ABV3XZN4_9RHOB|nr:hypothetical protein [Rhodovulum robiginosum]RSK38879.1 hypothetical protein EJA01_01645 [Rhodovulum robiginosum]